MTDDWKRQPRPIRKSGGISPSPRAAGQPTPPQRPADRPKPLSDDDWKREDIGGGVERCPDDDPIGTLAKHLQIEPPSKSRSVKAACRRVYWRACWWRTFHPFASLDEQIQHRDRTIQRFREEIGEE